MIFNTIQNKKKFNKLLFPKASDRSKWDIPNLLKNQVLQDGLEAMSYSWPFLSLALFQEYTQNGNRSHYETPYFEKRRKLGSLVLAECVEYSGRFVPYIAEGIWSLLSEASWVIPAHNSYIRDTPALASPLLDRPILDLFSCETAALLALSCFLLEEELNKEVGSELVLSARHQLKTRLINPFLNDYFWWMGGRGEKLNNWTPWCIQNVLLSSLVLDISDEQKTAILEKTAVSLDDWLSQYGEDGCCDEGASYWHAAGLCLWGSLHLLDQAQVVDVIPLFQNQKIRNIASYITNVHIADDLYLNFADCSPKAGRLGVREYLFGKATQNISLMNHALIDFKEDPLYQEDNNYNLFYRLLKLMHGKELLEAPLPKVKKREPFIWYPSAGLAVYRKGSFTLGVKAGNNDDSHNHNDTGSIILYSGTTPMLIDVGVETYTKTTFSKDRYTLWPMQSHYHNVCNLPPYGQEAGPQFKAELIGIDENHIELELRQAYPEEAKLKSYRRLIQLQNNSIRITETLQSEIPPVLSIMTATKPEQKDTELIFDSWSISFNTNIQPTIETIPISDARLRHTWTDTLYRILVPFADRLCWTISV